MRIVVFGASGRTGLELVNQALDKNHDVVAFIRNPAKFLLRHQKLSIARGDVLNKEQVESVVSGCEGSVFAVGGKPWEKKPVCTEGIRNVIAAMQKHNAQRLVVESAYGVKETKRGIYGRLLWIIIKDIMKDKESMEDAINATQLDWVIVRPTILTKGAKTGTYRIGHNLQLGILPRISRADVADFMIKQLTDNTFLRRSPTVSY